MRKRVAVLVHDIVRRNATFFGAAEAVVAPDGRVRSWAELDERTDRLANAFASLGISKGDRVAIYAPNCPEYVEFFFACAKSGVIGAAVNIRLAAAEIASYLVYVEPAAVIVHAELARAADGWLRNVPSVRTVVEIGSEAADVEYERLLATVEDTRPRVDVGETDVYQLVATSGTTGVPKGAMMTHRNAIAAMVNWLSEMPVPERGTALQCIPFFFNPGGPAGLHPVLMKGGKVVIPSAFTPQGFLDEVERHRVTNTVVVPTMLQMVLDHPDATAHKLSSLRGVNTGGSPLSADLLARGRELIGDVFYPIYGMAETYSCATMLRPEDQFSAGTQQQVRQLSSVGKPMVLAGVRVVDTEGEDVPADGATPGEIWLAGPTVSAGYFRMPEETQHSRHGRWFRTGDVAMVDGERFVTIVDRLKDMIITGGINVFSREVEQVITRHPDVEAAAVIGRPHPKWGEAVHAVVVTSTGARLTADEVIDFVGERLAAYKKPRSVEFVDELPVSGVGKVLKRELRNPHALPS